MSLACIDMMAEVSNDCAMRLTRDPSAEPVKHNTIEASAPVFLSLPARSSPCRLVTEVSSDCQAIHLVPSLGRLGEKVEGRPGSRQHSQGYSPVSE